MKILFVGLKVGAGVESICYSVKNECDKLDNIETEYVDIYAENKERAEFSKEHYYKLVKRFPRLVAFGQKVSLSLALNSRKKHFFINKDVECGKIELIKYLKRYNPDVVYTPLCAVAMAMDELIDSGEVKQKYVFQIPDFLVPYYTQNLKHVSYIISSCDYVTEQLQQRGVDAVKILNYGIPINSKFLTVDQDRQAILSKLGYEDRLYILISNGGAGFANNLKIITSFYNKVGDYGFIVVNGKNTESKVKIDKFIAENSIKNVINLGFVSNMQELMKISDIIIGKCGSSTINESSYSKLKFIGLNNFLVPESYNIKYLRLKNSIKVVKNKKEISHALEYFMNEKNGEISNNFFKLCNGKCAEQIAHLLKNI